MHFLTLTGVVLIGTFSFAILGYMCSIFLLQSKINFISRDYRWSIITVMSLLYIWLYEEFCALQFPSFLGMNVIRPALVYDEIYSKAILTINHVSLLRWVFQVFAGTEISILFYRPNHQLFPLLSCVFYYLYMLLQSVTQELFRDIFFLSNCTNANASTSLNLTSVDGLDFLNCFISIDKRDNSPCDPLLDRCGAEDDFRSNASVNNTTLSDTYRSKLRMQF